MKNILCIVFFSFLFSSNTLAQAYLFPNYEIKQAMDFYHFNRSEMERFAEVLPEKQIDGSPYLNEEFIEGSIFTTSKNLYVSIPLRYNIFNDQIEFYSNEGRAYAITVPEIIEKVVIGEYHLEYIPYQQAKKIRRGFFTIVVEGNATLYKRQIIIFEEEKKAAAFKDPQPPRFIGKPDKFYIRTGLDAAKPINKTKDLLKFFPDKNDTISNFIKNNKVKSNDENSLADLIRFCNSL